MPVYEYECQQCGDRIEALQRLSDPPLKKHDACGGRLKRMPSAPAIQFKGTGWYVTDYGRAGKTGGDGKKDGSETKTEAKEAKTESKTSAADKNDKPASTTSKKETKS